MGRYDATFKNEAVKLAGTIGRIEAAQELNMPQGTLDTWIMKAKTGGLHGTPINPKTALSLSEEIKQLKQENRELRQTNEILSKAAAFFAQSRKKPPLMSDLNSSVYTPMNTQLPKCAGC